MTYIFCVLCVQLFCSLLRRCSVECQDQGSEERAGGRNCGTAMFGRSVAAAGEDRLDRERKTVRRTDAADQSGARWNRSADSGFDDGSSELRGLLLQALSRYRTSAWWFLATGSEN